MTTMQMDRILEKMVALGKEDAVTYRRIWKYSRKRKGEDGI